MNGWKRSRRGGRLRLVTTLDAQEAAVLRGLVDEVRRMLGSRSDEQPHDELEELTGLQTGPSTRPDDPVLARLLPDFATDDTDLSGALRSLHEPELIATKDAAATIVLDTLPGEGRRVDLVGAARAFGGLSASAAATRPTPVVVNTGPSEKSWFSPAKIADTESSANTFLIVSARMPATVSTSTLAGFVSGSTATVSVTMSRSISLSAMRSSAGPLNRPWVAQA